MYIPSAFAETDLDRLSELMQAYPLASLVTWPEGTPVVTHVPTILEPNRGANGRLIGHLAKKNPQSAHLDGETEAMLIFQGAHAYISPSWYAGEFNVPTWNFTAVHAYGVPQPITDAAALCKTLDDQTASYEAHFSEPWSIPWNDERNHHMLAGLVAFEMTIDRIEGKFKLNQNKTAADRRKVIRELSASDRQEDLAVAQLMNANNETK